MIQEVSTGIYRHYKGNEYEVIGVGTHSETNERLVIYKSVLGSEIWIRPVAMFLETVRVDDETKPRFERIG